MKKRKADLSEKEVMRTLDALYTAAGSLWGRAAMKLFLRDMLTESERLMCGRRILIARQLLAGRTYDEIQKSMGTAVRTISKVQRWLNDEFPGYEEAVRGLERAQERRASRAEANRLWRSLKRKYPLHFLLFPFPRSSK
jgi:uncharacterized protein YerC